MKRLSAVLLAVLFLPLAAEATIKRYSRGYTDSWCADKTKVVEGYTVPDFDPKSPTSVKGYCYSKAVTDYQNTTMTGHKTRAAVSGRGPTGLTVNKDSGLQTGVTSAAVQVPYYNWSPDYEYWSWFQVGEVFCPRGQMTAAAIFSSGKRRLGVSTICVTRDGNPRKPVKPIIGPQLGWITGYVPIIPCDVKCVATHYSIFVLGSGVPDAPTGTAQKGFSIDVNTGVETCTGFVVSFIPDGIPGILPCASKGCVETIISLP